MESSQPSQPMRPGDRLGKYELVEQIAVGGTSVVWKGRDPLLDRVVAIKQLAPDAAADPDPQGLRERFMQEVALQKQAAAGKPHLVQVIDFFEEPRGLFIVMEYVPGQTLEQKLQSEPGPMNQRAAVAVLICTALALDTLHRQNVLHRDLKPSNILLGDDGQIKLCDFGLATILEDQQTLSSGSVRYMAPELFQDQEADGRADLYSLGVIAYEMFVGRSAFENAFRIVLRDERNQAMRWMKWHTNPRTKATPVAELEPTVPEPLSQLVERLMEKDPAQRVSSAEQLVAAIRRCLTAQQAAPAGASAAGAPAPAAAAPVGDHPTAPLPRASKMPWVLAGMIGFWVLLGAGYWLYEAQQQNQAVENRVDQAERLFVEARDLLHDGQYVEAIAQFDALASQWPEHPILGTGSRARSLYAQARRAMDQQEYETARESLQAAIELDALDPDPLYQMLRGIDARIAFEKEVAYIEQLVEEGKFAQARDRLRQQQALSLTPEEMAALDEVGKTIEGQQTQRQIESQLAQAEALAAEGDRLGAISLLRQALARYGRGDIRELLNRYEKEATIERARAEAEAAMAAGEWAEALKHYQQINRLAPSQETGQTIRQLQSELALEDARAHEAAGRTSEAQQAYQRAMSLHENDEAREALARLASTTERDTLVQAGNQALASGYYDTAIGHYQRAQKIESSEEVAASLAEARVLLNLQQAQAALAQEKLDRAQTLFETVLEARPQSEAAVRGLSQIRRMQRYLEHLNKGDGYRKESKFREAKLEYTRAQDVMDTPDVQERLNDIEYQSLIAAAMRDMAQKNWPSARAWLLTAKSRRDTEQVNQMLAEVNERDPLPPSANEEDE